MLLVGFKNEKLKPLTGKTLAEVAKMRNTTPEDTAIDLVIDAGANRGQYARVLREEGWAGPIVSIEPIPEVGKMCRPAAKMMIRGMPITK